VVIERNATAARFLLSRVLVVAFIPLMAINACTALKGSAGDLRAISLTDQSAMLPLRFVTAFYAPDRNGSTTVMLADAPLEKFLESPPEQGQILHVELLWNPLPGRTPMDPSATNASLRLIVFVQGEVGIYSGAGFALPFSDPAAGKTLSLTLRDATLQLEESTAGFRDVLGATQMTGSLTAAKDEKKTRLLNQAASQLVTNAFGRTRYVLNSR
jgi:hypothetical protein